MSVGDRHESTRERGGAEERECILIREEIVASVFGDKAAVRETVSLHLEKCPRCREWEREIRRMHESCRSRRAVLDPARLTESVLSRPDIPSMLASDTRGAARRRAVRASDRGTLYLAVVAAALVQGILAAVLHGRGAPIQAASFASMLAATIWVHFDSARRGMPGAFWTALQPFTVPAGLVAYVACRSRESAKCPSCGRIVSSRGGFCRSCGAKLTEFCCGCGKPVRKEFRVCPFCGTRLSECFEREDEGARTCGWSARQVAFVVAVNAALLAGVLGVLLGGARSAAVIAAPFYVFGWVPLFNWVSIDSRRRAMATVWWGLLVVLTLYIGFVIYLACRRDARIVCPVCGSYPPVSFNFCPCCGSSLGSVCPACGAATDLEGRFCSACGEKLA